MNSREITTANNVRLLGITLRKLSKLCIVRRRYTLQLLTVDQQSTTIS